MPSPAQQSAKEEEWKRPQGTAICSSAIASATVANQPTYDRGGFAFRVIEVIDGISHPWETLCDQVTLFALPCARQEPAISVFGRVEEMNAPQLPVSVRENVAGRAVDAAIQMVQRKGIQWQWDVHIAVNKGISLQGTGLGSSGASVAATLKAFQHLLPMLGLSTCDDAELLQLLVDADAGVPDNSIPSFLGGWQLLHHTRDMWETQQLHCSTFGSFVIVSPRGFGIHTADARTAISDSIPKELDRDSRRLIDCIERGDVALYAAKMEKTHEWFVQPRSRLYPHNGAVYDDVKYAAKGAGALGVTITGAGPSILAIADTPNKARNVGRAMCHAFKKYGFDSVARLIAIQPDGAFAVPSSFYAIP